MAAAARGPEASQLPGISECMANYLSNEHAAVAAAAGMVMSGRTCVDVCICLCLCACTRVNYDHIRLICSPKWVNSTCLDQPTSYPQNPHFTSSPTVSASLETPHVIARSRPHFMALSLTHMQTHFTGARAMRIRSDEASYRYQSQMRAQRQKKRGHQAPAPAPAAPKAKSKPEPPSPTDRNRRMTKIIKVSSARACGIGCGGILAFTRALHANY